MLVPMKEASHFRCNVFPHDDLLCHYLLQNVNTGGKFKEQKGHDAVGESCKTNIW